MRYIFVNFVCSTDFSLLFETKSSRLNLRACHPPIKIDIFLRTFCYEFYEIYFFCDFADVFLQ